MLSASAQSKVCVMVLFLLAGQLSACRGKHPVSARVSDAGLAPGPVAPPVNLEGIVKDRRGTPLPDVLIIAWPKGKRGQAVAQGRSDEEGRFILPGLRPDRWELLVEAAGLGTLETERQVPDDGSAELMLDGESRTLSGIVVDSAGRPQSGARVTVGSLGLRWTRTAVSDPNGTFTVSGLGMGKYTLRATADAKTSVGTEAIFDESTLRPLHVRLVLQPGVFVDGRVLDDSGRVLAGAVVDVLAVPSDDLPVSGQSGSDGRYRLGPIAPGKYQLLARLEDFVPLDSPEPQLGPHARASFDLRLARTARIAGRVVDEAGQPMVGVQVSVIGLVAGRDELVVLPGGLPLAAEAADMPLGGLLRQGGERSCPTDKNGVFTIAGLAPGRARLVIHHPDKLPFRLEPLSLASGDARDLGKLVVMSGGVLAGRILDEKGQPIEAAVVDARPAGRSATPALRVPTDREGKFTIRVPVGSYIVTAQTETLAAPGPLAIHVGANETAEPSVLQLVPKATSYRDRSTRPSSSRRSSRR
jgi:protocatechuate 3,4-dioxygenase beta subunit